MFFYCSMHPPRRGRFPQEVLSDEGPLIPQTVIPVHRLDFHCVASMSYCRRLHDETSRPSIPRRKMWHFGKKFLCKICIKGLVIHLIFCLLVLGSPSTMRSNMTLKGPLPMILMDHGGILVRLSKSSKTSDGLILW